MLDLISYVLSRAIVVVLMVVLLVAACGCSGTNSHRDEGAGYSYVEVEFNRSHKIDCRFGYARKFPGEHELEVGMHVYQEFDVRDAPGLDPFSVGTTGVGVRAKRKW
jgi:uncharacterized protein YceK